MADVTGATTAPGRVADASPVRTPDAGTGAAGSPGGAVTGDRPTGSGHDVGTGQVVVDLDAIASNVASLARRTGTPVLAVVKADAYGHGLVRVARAALAGGASWLGVAQLDEAVRLREAGVDAPLLAWLMVPDPEPVAAALARQVTLGLSHPAQLAAVLQAARDGGQVADVHVKVDTGLNRNGVPMAELPAFAAELAQAERAGLVGVSGVFSHLAWADAPRHPTVDRQAAVFAEAVRVVREAGLRPSWRHLANSAATLTRPDLHLDLVRPGLAVYGLSPVPDLATPAELGLRPALTLRSRLVLTKPAAAGDGASYGHAWTAPVDTVLGLVPLGYADGLPRSATGSAEVWVGGRRVPVVGRICMDQVVVDLGPGARDAVGDEVVVMGPGDLGEPTAEDWAVAAGTISYEVVARLGSRLPRRWVGTGEVVLVEDEPPLLDLGDGGAAVDAGAPDAADGTDDGTDDGDTDGDTGSGSPTGRTDDIEQETTW